jgi:hypothetical protein
MLDAPDTRDSIGQFEGVGKGSGAQVRAPAWAVREFANGRIARTVNYLDEHEALKAAGLEE